MPSKCFSTARTLRPWCDRGACAPAVWLERGVAGVIAGDELAQQRRDPLRKLGELAQLRELVSDPQRTTQFRCTKVAHTAQSPGRLRDETT